MTTDITALQNSAVEERYRVLVDAITDYAIYMLDTRGHVSSWNSGANRFEGYVEAEILGEHFSRFYTPEDRERGVPARALSTAAAEGRFEAEGWRVRKDGTRLWAHVVIDAIRDANGQLLGFAKITRDLSERKVAEDALRRSESSSADWFKALPITPSTCWTPKGVSRAETRARNGKRASIPKRS